MFFKKKKEELSDQLITFREREAPRLGAPNFKLDTGITIDGFDGEGQMGNVSISGCSLSSVTYINITPNEIYNVKIIPGKEDKMMPFTLKMKLNWTKCSETVFIAGFSLAEGENNAMLESYVRLLRSRGIIPDYGNMSHKP